MMSLLAISSAVRISADVASALLGLAMLLAFVRLVRGPSILDRIIALDLIASIAVSLIAVRAITSDQRADLMVAIVLALIAFIGTVAFADYVSKGGKE